MPIWTGAVSTDWGTSGNWAIDGSGNTGVPTATTSAFFTAASGGKPCTISSGATCLNLDFTGYAVGVGPNTAVITFNNLLTVRGNITLSSTMGNFVGPNGILFTTTASSTTFTFTSNNKAFNLPFAITSNTNTLTFVNTWTVTNFTVNAVSGNPITYTGGTVQVTGNLTNNQPSAASTTQFVLTGTGTFSTIQNWSPPIEINTAGVITVGNVTLTNNCVFKYTTASNITATGLVTVGVATLDLQNQAFNNFQLLGNGTVTLSSPANFLHATFGGANTGVFLNGAGQRFNVRGNLSIAQVTGFLSGTGILSLTGTGTISSASAALSLNNSAIGVDFELNTSGTYTVTSNMSFTNSKTFTRINGLINWQNYTLFINSTNCTLNTSGITFNNITIGNTFTLNITSLLSLSGILLLNGTTTFAGTHGFSTNTLTCLVTGSTITLQNNTASPNATYYISTALNLTGASSASRITLQASGSATFNARAGSPSSNSLQYVSGTVPSVGMTVSQETGQSPVGFSNLLPTRPVINGGTSPNFTLDQTIVPSIPFPPTGTISMRAGYKAIFTLQSGAFQNVAYVTTQDIDSLSNSGATILSFGSNNDDVATNVFLYRTLNWGPLVASSGSAYKTWVD